MHKVEFENVTLWHADCLDVLPLLSGVDAVITDPPYGLGAKMKGGTWAAQPHNEGFLKWDMAIEQRWIDAILSLNTPAVIWGGNYFADCLPATSRWLVWDKGQRIKQSDGELAWTSLDGALRIKTLNRVSIMLDGAMHPTQKLLL